jgi:hypothetical protein
LSEEKKALTVVVLSFLLIVCSFSACHDVENASIILIAIGVEAFNDSLILAKLNDATNP